MKILWQASLPLEFKISIYLNLQLTNLLCDEATQIIIIKI